MASFLVGGQGRSPAVMRTGASEDDGGNAGRLEPCIAQRIRRITSNAFVSFSCLTSAEAVDRPATRVAWRRAASRVNEPCQRSARVYRRDRGRRIAQSRVFGVHATEGPPEIAAPKLSNNLTRRDVGRRTLRQMQVSFRHKKAPLVKRPFESRSQRGFWSLLT